MSRKVVTRLAISLFFTVFFLAIVIAVLFFRPHYTERTATKFSLAQNVVKRANDQVSVTYKENLLNCWLTLENRIILSNCIKEQVIAKGKIKYKKNTYCSNDEFTSLEDSSGILIERTNGEILVYSKDELLKVAQDEDKKKLDTIEKELKELPLVSSCDLRISITSSNSGSKWKIYVYSNGLIDEKQILSCLDFNIVKLRKDEQVKYIFFSKNYSKPHQYLVSIKGDRNFYLAHDEAFVLNFDPLSTSCNDSRLIKEYTNAIKLLQHHYESLSKIASVNYIPSTAEILKKYKLII